MRVRGENGGDEERKEGERKGEELVVMARKEGGIRMRGGERREKSGRELR